MGRPKKNRANVETVQTLERDETENLERHEPEPQPKPEEQVSAPKSPKVRKSEGPNEEQTDAPINYAAHRLTREQRYEQAQRAKAAAPPDKRIGPDHELNHKMVENLVCGFLQAKDRGFVTDEDESFIKVLLERIPAAGCVPCGNNCYYGRYLEFANDRSRWLNYPHCY